MFNKEFEDEFHYGINDISKYREALDDSPDYKFDCFSFLFPFFSNYFFETVPPFMLFSLWSLQSLQALNLCRTDLKVEPAGKLGAKNSTVRTIFIFPFAPEPFDTKQPLFGRHPDQVSAAVLGLIESLPWLRRTVIHIERTIDKS